MISFGIARPSAAARLCDNGRLCTPPPPNLRGYVWVGAMNGAKIATLDDVSRRGPPTERTLLRDV